MDNAYKSCFLLESSFLYDASEQLSSESKIAIKWIISDKLLFLSTLWN